MATAYTDALGNAWLIDDTSGVFRGKLAAPAYETPVLQVVVAAPTMTEAKAAIEEYAKEYDATNTRPTPRIMATVTAPKSGGGGALILVLILLAALAKGKR